MVRRRLAAVLCADVAAFTRLMNSDEGGTLRMLAARRETTDRLIAQHNGRIANTAGDSVLAEFPSAVDAVKCAIAIQERVAGANDGIPEDQRVVFRIGVHVGEVTERNGDLLGDEVNVTARLQALAQPGSVCISGAAHEHVRRVLSTTFEDLGLQHVKNLDDPVRAYRIRTVNPVTVRDIPTVHRRIEANLGRRFHEVLQKALRGIAKAEGIPLVALAVLGSVDDAPGLDLGQLGKRTGIEPARMRRLVALLEGRHLVAWLPRSHGAGGLGLTPAGLEVFRRVHPLAVASMDRVMAPLSDRERETLRELLTRIIKANE
jgi:class 3 adenylate cyclase/DNA-binding MarR family transcriptional regulator